MTAGLTSDHVFGAMFLLAALGLAVGIMRADGTAPAREHYFDLAACLGCLLLGVGLLAPRPSLADTGFWLMVFGLGGDAVARRLERARWKG